MVMHGHCDATRNREVGYYIEEPVEGGTTYYIPMVEFHLRIVERYANKRYEENA